MTKSRLIPLFLVIAALAVSISPGGARPSSEKRLIDRVIVVVEDRALLQSEYDMEYKRILLQMGRNSDISESDREALRKEVLDGLVADLLMAVHAERTGIEIEQESVDAEVEEAIANNVKSLGGAEAFEKELERNGLSEQQLRRQWREKIKSRKLIEKLMYSEVMADVEVTTKELKEFYVEKASELPMRPETVTLSQILILPEASGQSRAKALEKIQAVDEKLREGADFEELAREYSEGPSAEYGGNLGFVNLEDLNNPEFAEAASKLEAGEVSPPVLTNFGYHLIKLEEKKDGEYHLRHILVKAEEGESELETARERAEEIRNRIKEGADFGEMAAQYSKDENSRKRGGLVGEVPAANLPEFFAESIKGVKIGGLAPVIKDEKGFRIIKVVDRQQPRPFKFKEAEEELRNVLRQEKLQQRYADYVDSLKDKYYVDIKADVTR